MNETAALLEALVGYFGRYLVLTEDHRLAVSLWALHTHVCDAFSTTPYLIVTSAEPRSGKSRLLECLYAVVRNPDPLIAPTEAVLFRGMADEPTLLLDETDAIFSNSKFGPSEKQEGLRAILNAGYRKGATVKRCLNGSSDLERFPVFGPKALAGIGHLPVTIEDRGLCIRLTRRMPTETIERFRYETGIEWGLQLRPRIEAWATVARIMLGGARPVLPDELDDRAQDAYEVLIAIADMAGRPWDEQARSALVTLRNAETTLRESLGMRLFRDMGLFVERLSKMERIATVDFLAWLYEHGDEPWEDWWGESSGRKAAKRLSGVLAEYDVRPSERWQEMGVRQRGYLVTELVGARARYLGETWAHGQEDEMPSGDAVLSVPMSSDQTWAGAHVNTPPKGGDLQGVAHVPMLSPGVRPDGLEEGLSEEDIVTLGQASLDELRDHFEGT